MAQMLSSEMVKKIRRIEIKSNRLVEEIFSGEYRSGFKGKGMEFDSIRQYYAGDDVRAIDWNVTARHNKAFVKQFSEERELNLFLLIDMSRSNSFGGKKTLIAELGATLAFSASRNNDRVGSIFFTDRVEKVIPSKNGRKHILSLIENILSFEPESRGTNLAHVLQVLNRIEKKRSIVFVLSDFLDEGYQKEVSMTATKHDLVMIRVADRAEERIPAGAIFTFEDLESGETVVLDNRRKDYGPERKPASSGYPLLTLYTDEDYAKPLEHFFRRRVWR